LHDLAYELVPADEVGGAFQVAAVKVQVAAAEGGGSYAEDSVGFVLEFWGGAVFDFDLGVKSDVSGEENAKAMRG